MTQKKFTEASDAEIYENLRDSQAAADAQRLLDQGLAAAGTRWCCTRFLASKNPVIKFNDGTQLRVHFCPRCGREL